MPSRRLDSGADRRIRGPGRLITTGPGSISWLGAVVAGSLIAVSMPPWGWWPLAPVGAAVMFVALQSATSWRWRAAAGFLVGLPWMLISMAWMWFLTAPGYVLAAMVFACFHAVAAAVTPAGPWRLLAGPAAHSLAEVARMFFPFGGVPLATMGISQAGGPMLPIARVGGVILLTWVVFQLGAAVAAAVSTPQRRSALIATAAIAVLFVGSTLAPAGADTGRSYQIAAVQGGGEQGTSAIDVPSARVTEALLNTTASIDPSPDRDLVIWPENGIDVDDEPFESSEPFDRVVSEARRLGVPISVGVTDDSEYSLHPRRGGFANAQVIVSPDGAVNDRYEKVQLVPFGEYVPGRALFEGLGVDLSAVASDAVSGRAPAQLDLPDGTRAGVMISWEVFFGRRGRAAVDDGAEFLINPTNGASYTWTIVQSQQIASSRLRAMETGRWVVQVAPTGYSAFVAPTGEVYDRTSVSERAVIERSIELRTDATWYTRLGDRPWIVALVIVLAVCWLGTLRHRRSSATAARPSP